MSSTNQPLKSRKPVSGRVSSGRGPVALVPREANFGKSGARGDSIGLDGAESEAIRRAGDFG
jgi:hypothetical protein